MASKRCFPRRARSAATEFALAAKFVPCDEFFSIVPRTSSRAGKGWRNGARPVSFEVGAGALVCLYGVVCVGNATLGPGVLAGWEADVK